MKIKRICGHEEDHPFITEDIIHSWQLKFGDEPCSRCRYVTIPHHNERRRYALLQAAAELYASLTKDCQGERWLERGDGEILNCVDRAEALLAEIERREAECEKSTKT